MASIGQNTKYLKRFDKVAKGMCLIGATDEELANAFDISVVTLNTWKKKHPSFLKALKEGKEDADINVGTSLYQRATGYDAPDTHFTSHEGQVIQTPTTKHYPPDVTAQIFWLKNRRPKQFREKQDVELSGEVQIDVAEIAAAAAIARKNRGL